MDEIKVTVEGLTTERRSAVEQKPEALLRCRNVFKFQIRNGAHHHVESYVSIFQLFYICTRTIPVDFS